MKELKGKISIIMPAYNEASHIVSSIKETADAFDGFGYEWELLVIDDGSRDNTFEAACSLLDKYPGRLIVKKNPLNMGKGAAIKLAVEYITGEYVVWLDADMDLHPSQLPTLFDIMLLDDAGVVIGSKLHPNSRVIYPLQRRIISNVYYLLIKFLFDLPCHDTQTGLKLFKSEVLRRVFPMMTVNKFAFDLEVLAIVNRLGFQIAEAPIVLNPRRRYGRIGMTAIITTFWDTLVVFYRMHVLKYYDRFDNNRR
ncbi:MAG: glycosyltransferase [Candidatus Omnitrophica bacterium]|nr:glycosyltransferase [Candidatus Omnitrophota bacterium]